MQHPKVKRGRFTNYRTGVFIEFLYNPDRITDRKGVNLIVDPIPGQSDALVRFASGRENNISFTLKLCGESSLRRRGINFLNGAVAEKPVSVATTTYSIAGEIEWFRSFEHPVDPELPLRAAFSTSSSRLKSDDRFGGPDLVVFTFGRLYQGVLCAVESVDVDIHEFSPELDPTKADLSIALKRVVTENRFAHTIYQPPIETEPFL